MTSLDHALSDRLPIAGSDAPAPLWRRFLQRFAGGIRTGGEPPLARLPRVKRPPVYRISRVWANRWVVLLPGSALGHVFESAAEAEAFVRGKCGDKASMVEIEIGDLYVAARLEPNRPLLFSSCR